MNGQAAACGSCQKERTWPLHPSPVPAWRRTGPQLAWNAAHKPVASGISRERCRATGESAGACRLRLGARHRRPPYYRRVLAKAWDEVTWRSVCLGPRDEKGGVSSAGLDRDGRGFCPRAPAALDGAHGHFLRFRAGVLRAVGTISLHAGVDAAHTERRPVVGDRGPSHTHGPADRRDVDLLLGTRFMVHCSPRRPRGARSGPCPSNGEIFPS